MLLELPPYEKSLQRTLLQSLIHYWYWYLPVVLLVLFLIAMSIRIVRLNRSLTEHKKTLKQSQEAQIATFEQVAVGLAHITPSGQLLNMNRRLCTITGYPIEALQQINLKDLVLSDDLATVTEAFDRLRLNHLDNVTIQFRLHCADGTFKWCQLTLSNMPSGNKASGYTVGVIDDIHHYKQLEEEKRQAQQQTALILKVAGEGIMGLDIEGRHSFVNPAAARILGYEIEEMLHKSSHDLWHHSHADGSSYPVDECPITGVLQHGEISRNDHDVFWRKDGSPVAVKYISTPIFIDGEIRGAVVVFHPAKAEFAEAATG
ncbi:MAG: PAS domain-containing protein [Candidatus Thiodiazotropha sp.]